MIRPHRMLSAVFRRELATVVKTPGYVVLAIALLVALLGFVGVGGGGTTGFIPAVVDLLLITELLVPVIAVIIGYRALLADVSSGEMAVIRTYSVGAGTYVCAVLLARFLAFLAIVGIPYLLVGAGIWLTASPDTGIYATHAGVDSPLLYLRFLAFVIVLGAAYLVLAAAISAIASTRRTALAIGGVVLVGGIFGGDVVAMASLGTSSSTDGLAGLVAVSPNGAFRGLVLEHVVAVAVDDAGGYVDSGRAIGMLIGWTALGVISAVGVRGYGQYVGTSLERLRCRYLK